MGKTKKQHSDMWDEPMECYICEETNCDKCRIAHNYQKKIKKTKNKKRNTYDSFD